jgi:hypothetical protein
MNITGRQGGDFVMQLKRKCFVIPHKQDDEVVIKIKDIKDVNIPIEKVILEIISRIYKEGVNVS